MAGGDPPPPDPFYAPIHADALATEIKTIRNALDPSQKTTT
jgi:hypothetical protein